MRIFVGMPMIPHLFVYGTLLSSAGHPMGARLRAQAALLGEASIAGRLYRVGRYPGLVESHQREERVHGEVYVLANPTAALRWLDAYEGILPDNSKGNEYERVERSVRLATGELLTAWVYIYRKPIALHRLIRSGRWTSPDL